MPEIYEYVECSNSAKAINEWAKQGWRLRCATEFRAYMERKVFDESKDNVVMSIMESRSNQ